MPREQGCTLLVQNLSANVRTEHVLEIFGTYGYVVRARVWEVSSGAWRECTVEYAKREHAEQARLFMDGGQIDGLVVRVSVLPGRRRSRSASRSRSRSRSSRRSSSSSASSSSSSSSASPRSPSESPPMTPSPPEPVPQPPPPPSP